MGVARTLPKRRQPEKLLTDLRLSHLRIFFLISIEYLGQKNIYAYLIFHILSNNMSYIYFFLSVMFFPKNAGVGTWHHISEDSKLHSHLSGNGRSYIY
jgi:hypothetical protein